MRAFAVLYGVLRTAALFAVVALFFGLSFPDANFLAALVLLAVVSTSFVGVGARRRGSAPSSSRSRSSPPCRSPVGLLVFRAGERYAKRHGKLKRSG